MRRVALFASLPDEIPTAPIFEALRRAGRIPLLPRLRGDGALEFAPVACAETLRRGPVGVLEPPASAPAAALGPGDLALVPGLGFDRAGRRLGRGGGGYDRTFPVGAPAPLLVGLSFALQQREAIPVEAHDRPMDLLLSERGWRMPWRGSGR